VIVFDLQCSSGHLFEGWFSDDGDFQHQVQTGFLSCPVCSDRQIARRLSAPRLNVGARPPAGALAGTAEDSGPTELDRQRLWLEVARHVVATTADVGNQFSEVARQMHSGETPARAIRGQATLTEVVSLLQDGVPVQALILPDIAKTRLQ